MPESVAGLTFSKAQIRAIGDATITWLGSFVHLGLLGPYIMQIAKAGWDTAGVDAVAVILTDLGATVTD